MKFNWNHVGMFLTFIVGLTLIFPASLAAFSQDDVGDIGYYLISFEELPDFEQRSFPGEQRPLWAGDDSRVRDQRRCVDRDR